MPTEVDVNSSRFTIPSSHATSPSTQLYSILLFCTSYFQLMNALFCFCHGGQTQMQPTVQGESVRMAYFLASSDTCTSRLRRYADAMASIAMPGHPLWFPGAKPDSPSLKETVHASILADFMGEIEGARLEYASCARN